MSEYSWLWLYFYFWPKNWKSTWYLRFVLYAPRSTVQCVAVDIILIEASRLAISAFISWMSPSTLLISWLHFLKIIHTSKNHRSQTLLRFFSTFNFFSPQHWNRYQTNLTIIKLTLENEPCQELDMENREAFHRDHTKAAIVL